jgi:hypothetical protein
VTGELSGRHDGVRAGEDAAGIRDGHTGAHLAKVERGDPPRDRLGERQSLL